MIKVGIVGYGTVGKRVADTVAAQEDMELVGVTVRSYNQRVLAAVKKEYKLYAVGDTTEFKEHNVPIAGTMQELLQQVDIVVDGTPGKFGVANLDMYKKAGVKAILQGGEKDADVEASFNAQNNYQESLNKDYVRVVSCNTTALSRVLGALHKKIKLGHISVTLMRRAMDPGQQGKTVMNAIMPTFQFPSHHGPDVKTIIPALDISSVAFKMPTTLMHVHSVEIDLEENVTVAQVKEILKKTTRVHVIPANSGIESTAQVMELGKDLGHPRGDFMEAGIWEKGINISGKKLNIMIAVHQESIIVPDNIDCIRAMMGIEDAEKSIAMTNKSLGL